MNSPSITVHALWEHATHGLSHRQRSDWMRSFLSVSFPRQRSHASVTPYRAWGTSLCIKRVPHKPQQAVKQAVAKERVFQNVHPDGIYPESRKRNSFLLSFFETLMLSGSAMPRTAVTPSGGSLKPDIQEWGLEKLPARTTHQTDSINRVNTTAAFCLTEY